jgi:serine/threonine protein kinase
MTIKKFNLPRGFRIAGKYEVIGKLGSGWEGEVYRVRERAIGAERAAKLFFPHSNDRDKATRFYARKLHKLRHCSIMIQYLTRERIELKGVPVTVLISEYVEGELLNRFISRQKGRRLTEFEGLHLLHELAQGVETIHKAYEYHGDLHDDNIIVRRQGLSFNVKVIDMFNWGRPNSQNIRDDVCDLVRLFYDCLGGAKRYHKHSGEIKNIICGLKRTLITRKFRTAGHLRKHLETMEWA